MEVGVRRHRQKNNSSLTDQEGIPRSMEAEDLSCTEGLQHFLPHRETVALSSSPGHFHWQHPPPNIQTFQTFSGWEGTSNARCQELTSITSLRTSWWRETVDIPTSPKQRQMKQVMPQSPTLGWCHSHIPRALGTVLRTATSCNIWKSFPSGNKDDVLLSFPHQHTALKWKQHIFSSTLLPNIVLHMLFMQSCI